MAKFIEYLSEKAPEHIMRERSETFLSHISKRRTVRDFSDKSVPMEVIMNCIKSANTAPSGANKQPWHFVVITDKEIRRNIRVAAEEEEYKFYHGRAGDEWLEDLEPFGTDQHKPFLETAPCLITIFAESYGLKENGEKSKNYYVKESVGIATGFLIAALHDAGLATLTHTPSPMNFLNTICNRPANEKPYILLVVGYPAIGAKVPNITKKRFEDLCSFI